MGRGARRDIFFEQESYSPLDKGKEKKREEKIEDGKNPHFPLDKQDGSLPYFPLICWMVKYLLELCLGNLSNKETKQVFGKPLCFFLGSGKANITFIIRVIVIESCKFEFTSPFLPFYHQKN